MVIEANDVIGVAAEFVGGQVEFGDSQAVACRQAARQQIELQSPSAIHLLIEPGQPLPQDVVLALQMVQFGRDRLELGLNGLQMLQEALESGGIIDRAERVPALAEVGARRSAWVILGTHGYCWLRIIRRKTLPNNGQPHWPPAGSRRAVAVNSRLDSSESIVTLQKPLNRGSARAEARGSWGLG